MAVSAENSSVAGKSIRKRPCSPLGNKALEKMDAVQGIL
jgi:hypothetical protein